MMGLLTALGLACATVASAASVTISNKDPRLDTAGKIMVSRAYCSPPPIRARAPSQSKRCHPCLSKA